MPFFEILTLSIGASIAKSILGSWLKDHSIWEAALKASVDNLKKLVEGQIGSRASVSHLEALGEQIVRRIQPLFEHEARDLEPESRDVLAVQLAQTLNESELTVQKVIDENINAERINRLLTETRSNATRDLSAGQTAIYERMLEELSLEIVQTADKFAGFLPIALGAGLQNQDKIQNTEEKILNGIMALLEQPAREDKEFKDDYFRLIQDRLDRMEMFGIRRMDDITSVQSLSVAYINLQVQQKKIIDINLMKELPTRQMPEIEGENQEFSLIVPESQQQSESMNQILMTSRRLIVHGNAGSGKSTFLQWLAVRVAKNDLPGELADLQDTVPFFIRLRERVNKGFPPPEDFLILKSHGSPIFFGVYNIS